MKLFVMGSKDFKGQSTGNGVQSGAAGLLLVIRVQIHAFTL